MSELPRIDPSWSRKPRSVPKEDSFLLVILISAAVLLPALWVARDHHDLDSANRAAKKQSTALAAAAHLRQLDDMENERTVLHYITEAQANRELAAANGATFQDKEIHRCVYGSSDTFQLGPCRAPWREAPQTRSYSRRESIAKQNQTRLRAEARLRAEEQRFAALTGQQAGSWQPGYTSNPGDTARQRCALAKSQRDEAYRLVGNNRTLEFIRHWNDIVFQACRNV